MPLRGSTRGLREGTTMRFLIQVDANWHVHYVREDTNVCWGKVRVLRQLPQEGLDERAGRFPLPPADEAPALAGSGNALDELDILWNEYRSIVQRDLGSKGGVEKFGRYLFH